MHYKDFKKRNEQHCTVKTESLILSSDDFNDATYAFNGATYAFNDIADYS